jgi:hypothetical protein
MIPTDTYLCGLVETCSVGSFQIIGKCMAYNEQCQSIKKGIFIFYLKIVLFYLILSCIGRSCFLLLKGTISLTTLHVFILLAESK